MPKIEIKTPAGGWGTRFLIDGLEVPDIRSCELRIAVDEVVTAKLEVLATEELAFVGDVRLEVTVVALPGYVVVEETIDGVRRYRAEVSR